MVNPGDWCIDAGAHIGCYSASLATYVGETGRVLSFEPNKELFECLKHNCPNGHLHNCALGSQKCRKALQRVGQNRGAFWLTNADDGTADIEVVTIDDLNLEKLDFIKIDVEGMEPEVLQGGMNTIGKFKPAMFIEINHGALSRHGFTFSDIVDPLHKMGYKPRFLESEHTFDSAKWPQLDVVFTA